MPENNSRKKIMLIDDNITNLSLGKSVLSEKYDVITIPSGVKLFKMLERTIPDLILLDIEMPEMSGYDVIKRLKHMEATRHVPVIFLTAKNDDSSQLEGLTLGAVDYISKPFSPALLLKRIDVHLTIEAQKCELEEQKKELKEYNENLQEMVDKKTRTVVTLQNAVLQTVSELVECRDDVTGGHVERTQYFLRLLVNAAYAQGFYHAQLEEWRRDEFFFQSCQLHDVGKIAIRDSILMKPGKLTSEEFELMKTHTTFGAKVIAKIGRMTEERSFLEHARIFAESHHERWDGTGYPLGLCGEDIPLQGRLMAIADVYDALVSDRPYKKAFPHQEANDIIFSGKGSHFDPALADVFLTVADKFSQVTRLARIKEFDEDPEQRQLAEDKLAELVRVDA